MGRYNAFLDSGNEGGRTFLVLQKREEKRRIILCDQNKG